jgi:hypothetical protein
VTYIGQAGTDDLNVEKVPPTDGDGYDPVSCPGGLPVDLRSASHWRSKKVIKAEERGRQAFCFLVRMKKTDAAG